MRTAIITPIALVFHMVTKLKPPPKHMLTWKEKWLILIGGVSLRNDRSQIKGRK